jgi:NTP pyrophosphatase (non-canonical NTP hydrolase)
MIYNTLRDANRARHAEWFKDKPVSLLFRATELAGEVGELCNCIKKLERERLGVKGTRATLEQVADEIADVVVSADLLAMQFGISIAEAVERKFNAEIQMKKLTAIEDLQGRVKELERYNYLRGKPPTRLGNTLRFIVENIQVLERMIEERKSTEQHKPAA